MKKYLLSLLLVAACGDADNDADLVTEVQQQFATLPTEYSAPGRTLSDARIGLGRMLYFDKRLSKNQDISCNSCHDLAHYGVDGRAFSLGHRNQLGGRNAPTVYNAAAGLAQFWDGRAADVEAQALGPIRNPVEMAMPSDERVVQTVTSIPEYVAAFAQVFPGQPLTMAHIGEAIGAFERRLTSPGRWDRYLGGDATALTAAERDGLRTFLAAGCNTCHNGPALGGTSYRKAGVVRPWPGSSTDFGRYQVTMNEQDRYFFKVPTLRNIAQTAPYFHDSSAQTLPDAVRRMAAVEQGKDLSDAEVASITTFLEALTGELPTGYIQMPTLPASTAMTPLPDPN